MDFQSLKMTWHFVWLFVFLLSLFSYDPLACFWCSTPLIYVIKKMDRLWAITETLYSQLDLEREQLEDL